MLGGYKSFLNNEISFTVVITYHEKQSLNVTIVFLKTHTIVYYSVILKNELSSLEEACRNLKCTLLSERNQSEKG